VHYTIYKTTNNVNNKHYIGAHATTDANDKYIGSGKHLLRAIKKYGTASFSKEVIFMAKSEAIMYWIEEMLVDRAYVNNVNSYNLKTGGKSGSGLNRFTKEESCAIWKKRSESSLWVNGKTYEEIYGKERAIELKKLRSDTFKKIDKNGAKNPRAGFVTVYNASSEVVHEFDGTFRTATKELGLPTNALLQSYLNGGVKIYENIVDNGNIAILKSKGFYKYKGWYAIKR